MDNSGTETSSIVSGSSGENLACPNNAWKVADGIVDFGCKAAHPGHDLVKGLNGVPGGWNAGPGDPDKDDWLSFDFGSPKALVGFRYSGAGDKVHDAKDLVLAVGTSKNGPWTQVATFTALEGKNQPNTWNLAWQEFEFPATTSQHWKWTAKSPRYSQWQIWVGEFQFREPSDWGWWFLGFVFFGGVAYLGGGYAYNTSQKGRKQIPHAQLWRELQALVLDGVNLCRGGSSMSRSARSGGSSARHSSSGASAKSKKEKKKSSSSSGRQRVLDVPLATVSQTLSVCPCA